MRPLTELELTGRVRTHILQNDAPPVALHRDVVGPFHALRAAGAEAGLDIVALSAFRDFERQLVIWNRKFRGELALCTRATARDEIRRA